MDIPQKNKSYKIHIENLNSEGAGTGRIGGMAVFVPFTVPGEDVEALIIKVSKNYCVGKLVNVISPSPYRVSPQCPHFKKCGGCALQHIEYNEGFRAKCAHAMETISRISHLDVKAGSFIGMDNPWGYRNKAQFPLGIGGDFVIKAGFFSRRTHEIVDIDNCLLQHKDGVGLLNAVREAVKITNTPVYDEKNHKGLLRHIIFRTSFKTGEQMAILVTNGDKLPREEIWADIFFKRLPSLKSFVQNINKERGNVILGSKCRTIRGKSTIKDCISGIDFELSPLAFLQVNPVQAEKLYNKALKLCDLKGGEAVLDAYCGIGIMTQLIAGNAKKAIGVEISPDAINSAKASAEINRITNAEFICGAFEDEFKKLIDRGFFPDVLVLDPPRAGCAESVLTLAAEAGIERIVYVSCNPATLARDMAILASYGYSPSPVTFVDMFPMTNHVETVVLMSKVGVEYA